MRLKLRIEWGTIRNVARGGGAKARPPVTASHSHSMVPGGFDVMS
jgi:hypothetical protein